MPANDSLFRLIAILSPNPSHAHIPPSLPLFSLHHTQHHLLSSHYFSPNANIPACAVCGQSRFFISLQPELRYGVMVALQILVLPVQVRILVSQRQAGRDEVDLTSSRLFFAISDTRTCPQPYAYRQVRPQWRRLHRPSLSKPLSSVREAVFTDEIGKRRRSSVQGAVFTDEIGKRRRSSALGTFV